MGNLIPALDISSEWGVIMMNWEAKTKQNCGLHQDMRAFNAEYLPGLLGLYLTAISLPSISDASSYPDETRWQWEDKWWVDSLQAQGGET